MKPPNQNQDRHERQRRAFLRDMRSVRPLYLGVSVEGSSSFGAGGARLNAVAGRKNRQALKAAKNVRAGQSSPATRAHGASLEKVIPVGGDPVRASKRVTRQKNRGKKS